MDLTPIAAERTAALTNVILAGVALWGMLHLWRANGPRALVRLWIGMFAVAAIAAMIGAYYHGIDMRPAVRMALFIALSAAGAFFIAGTVGFWRGPAWGIRVLPALLLLVVGGSILVLAMGGNIAALVAVQGIALIFTALVFVRRARRGLVGARFVVYGCMLSLLAGALAATQALPTIATFDSNGVAHLLQITAFAFLAPGLRTSLANK